MARVFITGSSKGIGKATALELSRRGHEVIATARKLEALADLPVAMRLQLDVTDDASVARAVKQAGHVDVLINNAAEIALGPIESIPLDEVRRLYEINVFGSLRTIQAFAPAMRVRGSGTIVNLSSLVGHFSLPLNGVYGSTKFAVEALSEALRLELGHFGVQVVLIEPGEIGSGALDAPRAHLSEPDPYLPLAQSRKRTAREDMTPPETVARTIADAVESPQKQFRWRVGPDAEALLGARAKLDDVAFEGVLRKSLDLHW